MIATWLKPNRRAVMLGMLLPGAVAIVGALLSLGVFVPQAGPTPKIIGAVLVFFSAILLVGLGFQLWMPRIGYAAGCVMFNLRSGRPLRVPIKVVEGFLLGQAPALLPGGEKHRRTLTTTVVVRLSEKAQEWSGVEVNRRLASWCDSYITIRGTWCEPIDMGVIKRLNRLLAAATRESAVAVEGRQAK